MLGQSKSFGLITPSQSSIREIGLNWICFEIVWVAVVVRITLIQLGHNLPHWISRSGRFTVPCQNHTEILAFFSIIIENFIFFHLIRSDICCCNYVLSLVLVILSLLRYSSSLCLNAALACASMQLNCVNIAYFASILPICFLNHSICFKCLRRKKKHSKIIFKRLIMIINRSGWLLRLTKD